MEFLRENAPTLALVMTTAFVAVLLFVIRGLGRQERRLDRFIQNSFDAAIAAAISSAVAAVAAKERAHEQEITRLQDELARRSDAAAAADADEPPVR